MGHMSGPLPVLDHDSGGHDPSPGVLLWRIVLCAALCGVVALFALGHVLGDVDDHGWLFLLVGAILGALMGYATRRFSLPRRVAIPVAIVFFAIAGSINLVAVPSLVTDTNVITGQPLDGMAAIEPLLWIAGSILPSTAGILFLLLADPCRHPRH
jgi:ABC-type iron transport system FetAB permease component